MLAFFVSRLIAFLDASRTDIHWTVQTLIDVTGWLGAYGA